MWYYVSAKKEHKLFHFFNGGQNMKKLLAMALALCMVFALCACGQSAAPAAAPAASEAPAASAEPERTSFIMGIDPEYPPFSYLGDDGNYTGFDVEVCKAVCDKLGWEMKIFGVNWDEKLVQLDSMECDCVWSGMTILDSMKEAGYVISAPYYDNTQVLVVKADSGFASSADLAGKVVAVQLGTSGENLLNSQRPRVDLQQRPDLRQLPEVLYRARRRRCGCRVCRYAGCGELCQGPRGPQGHR